MSKTRFINFNNAKIGYRKQGKGKILVLLHGFLENSKIFDGFMEELSTNYQIILIDLPGHGTSDNIAELHTMELMAESVKAVLDYLVIDKITMIGHSMGGYVSLAFAEKYPEMMIGLGLFHSHALADTPEAKINRGRAIQVVKDNHQSFISMFIPDLFTKENQEKLAPQIIALQNEAKLINQESVIASLEGMRHRTDKLQLLSSIDYPFVFIIGKQDPRTPLDNMLKQIALPKHSEVLLLQDVAHMGYLEDFETTLSFVDSFMRRV